MRGRKGLIVDEYGVELLTKKSLGGGRRVTVGVNRVLKFRGVW